jgi:hypothetical protein
MITPSFALTATERVLPRLALDFTTASLDSRVTFTRSGGTATVTNASGNVVTIGANLPRFDFDPIALTCKGLLIEESRVNYVQQSADFATSWTLIGSTIQTNQITSPDGTLNADKIIEDTSNSIHLSLWNTAMPNCNQNLAFSCYFKANSRTKVRLSMVNGATGSGYNEANFNLSTVSVISTANAGNATGVAASITSVGNGWYRCVITGQPSTAADPVRADIYLLDAAGSASYLGDGVSNLYAWGAQLEIGAFGTSLIPTAGSQVTRTADIATMTGTNFSSWYNASEGAFLASAVLTRQAAIALTGIFSANDNTGLTNYMNAFYRGTGALGTNIYAGSVSQLDQNTLGVTVANTVVNIGIAYKLNNSVSYANATVQTTDTSVTIPTVTQLQLGFTPTGAYLNGILRNFRFWPQRILNAEGQAFSKG